MANTTSRFFLLPMDNMRYTERGHAGTHAFLEINLRNVKELYSRWMQMFPSIKPHYAVKCNPDIRIIETLAQLGCHFDCASGVEIQTVLNAGVPPDHILFANTCKLPCDIALAEREGVYRMTCDSIFELDKIAKYSPHARIILRIRLQDSQNTIIPFGSKFGASPDQWDGILDKAIESGVPIIGVSFHVGSGCSNPDAYSTALIEARKLMSLLEQREFSPYVIDIGGGFVSPIHSEIQYVIQDKLKTLFDPNVYEYIAEPGRFMVETCTTHYAQIIGKRIDDKEYKYWISDSIYGCFADVAHGYLTPEFEIVTRTLCDPVFHWTTIYGSTCDGGDVIAKHVRLPELEIGDWIKCENMGAYTKVLASGFNGMRFDAIRTVYVE
jgi:ornithine decarboxylase